VSGVRLEFKDGVVVNASAEEGEGYLRQALETDAGARRLGEIGIGTNAGIQRGTRNILFDEKIGGTAHLAIGSSYKECGGLNESALHWDLIMDLRGGGRISLDGEVFQENGRFV
jgi:aminopeptidase